MVVGGGVLIATGAGGPLGMMLVSAGADTIIQEATTGEVDWGEVSVSGAAGAVGFGVGGALAKTAVSTGVRTVAANAAEGAASGGGLNLTGPGPHTTGGLLASTALGAGMGAAGGGGGGARAAQEAETRIASTATRELKAVEPTPTHPALEAAKPDRPDFVVAGDGTAIQRADPASNEGFGTLSCRASQRPLRERSTRCRTDPALE